MNGDTEVNIILFLNSRVGRLSPGAAYTLLEGLCDCSGLPCTVFAAFWHQECPDSPHLFFGLLMRTDGQIEKGSTLPGVAILEAPFLSSNYCLFFFRPLVPS